MSIAAVSAAVGGPKALWYLTRGTGAIALILLTLSVVLGVTNVRRARTANVPRFVFDAVHRNASLLAIVFLLIHIVTSLLDGFAPIRVVDVFIPFGSAYRPLWLGFGAVAFDLLIAIAITSLLRRRFGYRAWRATHWAAYACWPIALLHGLGTGSDTKTTWMLAIAGACLIVVIVAVVARATDGWPDHAGARTTAIAASALVPLALIVWLPSGPLAAGWAKRAGTPPALLRATAATGTAAAANGSSGSSTGTGAAGGGGAAFTAPVSGTVRQGPEDDQQLVDITLAIKGQRLSTLEIRIVGRPIEGGGVDMTSSRVFVGTSGDPHLYRGRVTALQGTTIQARVSDAQGSHMTLAAQLQLDPNTGNATGTLTTNQGGG